jgi:hypothetical protein
MNTNQTKPNDDRLHELLVDRALDQLGREEQGELWKLLAEHPEVDADEFDRVAAAVLEAETRAGGTTAMPASLADKLVAAGKREVATIRELKGESAPAVVGRITPETARRAEPQADRDASRGLRIAAFGGWIAAAACLALFLLGNPLRDNVTVPTNPANPANPNPPTLSLAQSRQQLLGAGGDVMTVGWDPKGNVKGDVVWSTGKQKGYLRLAGLPKNDPAKAQYQLWIVDAKRPGQEPVDGGVFDVNADTGEVLVEIDAKLPVGQPAAFAVTREQPGGVVVSKQGKFEALAAPPAPATQPAQ